MPSPFTPVVFYRDPMAALRWLEQAFGFETSLLVTDDNGRVGHAEMGFGEGRVGIGEEWGAADLIGPAKMRSPASLDGQGTQFIRVELASGIDAHCARAEAAGAQDHPAPRRPVLRRPRLPRARSRRPRLELRPADRRGLDRRHGDGQRPEDRHLAAGRMTMNVPPICPLLFYRDARAALDFLERAFGFETRMVVDDGQGGVIHSETVFEDHVVMVSGPPPEKYASPLDLGGRATASICVQVKDGDRRALRTGAGRRRGDRARALRPGLRRPHLRLPRSGGAQLVRSARPSSR